MRPQFFTGGAKTYPTVTLGEIFNIGSSKRVLQKEWTRSGVPFFRAREIVKLARMGSVENELFISERHYRELEESHGVPQSGDLMVSAVGTLGACYVVKPLDRFYFKDASVLQLRAKQEIEPDFFRYLFLNDAFLIEVKKGEGATVGTLTISRAKGLRLSLPPLEEQKRIVAVLDQAFAALDRARALAEANLADVSTLRGQYLDDQITELFAEFGSIKVNEIAGVKGGKRLPKGQKTASDVTPYPYISVRDMTDEGTVNTASVQYISKANHEAIKRYTVSSSDVYVSIAGTIGKTGVVPAELHGANLTENAAKLILRTGWDRDFVYWWTRSGSFSDQAIEQTRTAAQPKLALERLGAIELPNADLNNQQALVACMERLRGSVRNLTDNYTGKLSELRDLRQSLLQMAFAGELT